MSVNELISKFIILFRGIVVILVLIIKFGFVPTARQTCHLVKFAEMALKEIQYPVNFLNYFKFYGDSFGCIIL